MLWLTHRNTLTESPPRGHGAGGGLEEDTETALTATRSDKREHDGRSRLGHASCLSREGAGVS